MAPLPSGLLVRFLEAFDRLRIDSLRVEEAYFDRLTKLDAGIAAATRSTGRARRRLLAAAWRVISVLPLLLRQYAKIVAKRAKANGVAVVIATNRTALVDRGDGFQDQLATLARDISFGAQHDIANRIQAARMLWIVDAVPVSRLWFDHRARVADAPIIIDSAFLVVFAAATAVRHPWLTVRAIRAIAAADRSRRSEKRFARLALTATLALAYGRLLEQARLSTVVCFTSNSFTVELFRTAVLHQKTVDVIEVMHGVGSIPFERYIDELLGTLTSAARMPLRVVPQVPNVKLYRSLSRLQSDAAAVNVYFNQYMAERSSMADLVEAVAEDLRVSPDGTKPVIVAIQGNFPTDARLLDSPSFQAECLLIKLITESASRLERSVHLVYCPHPAFGALNFSNEVFRRYRVAICPRTPSAWLGADICVSLMSSTLIESEFFGARALTPLLPTDGFFPQHYLADLAAPPRGSLDALIAMIETTLQCSIPTNDLASRIGTRLARTSWATEFAAIKALARV